MLAGSLSNVARYAVGALAVAAVCVPSGVGAQAVDAERRIRVEGIENGRAMRFAQSLSDDIGSRLTGSPGYDRAVAWAMATLRTLELTDVHAEDIGAFGMSWEAGDARLSLASPRPMALAAQVAPWSAASRGPMRGAAVWAPIASIADFLKYRGKLRGKVVFLGAVPATAPPGTASAARYVTADAQELNADTARYYARRPARMLELAARTRFKRELGRFLVAEGAAAIVLPSRGDGNGGTGLLTGDDSAMPVVAPWRADRQLPMPILYTAIEDFAMVARLSAAGARPAVTYDVTTRVGAREVHASNVVGEIAGTDPTLARQVVLVGAHLDSWIGGTGATDNGAGVAICLEAIRILKAIGATPKRTIRVVFYAGEEQGLLGSLAYARRHFGTIARSTDPVQRDIPVEGWRSAIAQPSLSPDHARLSVAFNIDGGSGRIRGLFTGGNPAMAAILRGWIGPLRDLGVATVVDAPTWPADQTSFTDLGLPAIDVAQDPLDYDTRSHHTDMDRHERLSPPDLAQAATVLATLVLRAANSAEPMPRVAGLAR